MIKYAPVHTSDDYLLRVSDRFHKIRRIYRSASRVVPLGFYQTVIQMQTVFETSNSNLIIKYSLLVLFKEY
jgi:hypothetical protein